MTPAAERVLARLEVRLERERELLRSGADADSPVTCTPIALASATNGPVGAGAATDATGAGDALATGCSALLVLR